MNNNIKHLLIVIAAGFIMSSCHKIEVTPNSLYTENVFPKTDAEFQSVMGTIYTSLRGHYSLAYWFAQELSSDEAILPVYGGNWFDGQGYIQLHRHDWNKDHGWITTVWNDANSIAGLCNQTMYIFKNAPEGESKNTAMAELKTLRAYAYWELLDMFGNVPLDTIYPSPGVQAKATRAEVYNFVVSELKAALPFLKTTTGSATYGKVTAWMANALLAKTYLNAEVYAGTAKYNECIAACDAIISSGNFAVEPRASYLSQFYPTNGPSFKEFIFAIPYDPSTNNGYLYHARYDLNRNLGIKYRYSGSTPGSYSFNQIILNQTTGNGLINARPSGPRATLSSFYNSYFRADAADIRRDQWLVGNQFWSDGSPMMVRTTKKGYDQFYTGADGGDAYTYQLYIDSVITARQTLVSIDLGNDEIAWNMGIRNIKFYPDANSSSRNQSNDAPIFRYSDILLMKAEAILRGGTATAGHTPLSLVNMVRNNRTTSPAWTSVTLDDLYAERAREFTWECWRRNDMIRFGKYENAYGFKSNADTYRRIFPIPTQAMNTNPKLVQNPGY
ncbi:RagB/SusD family nutrient uptake outer membrane protein [Niabella sp. W65]|nr:RagB/SusD family nutrient uptake outer membrane protein [Niabella sp. W65]MCH7363480.1 RagB/SusD family nutrient uptake outer membrane protein [Niabella sp. W65]ULT39400.1 RagB/SusD family nutrient uptake outer membrane protein [Niabella sp. I65]